MVPSPSGRCTRAVTHCAVAAFFALCAAGQGTPYLVADLTTTPPGAAVAVTCGAVAGSFSVALTAAESELRIWRTDGTSAGTSLLRAVPAASVAGLAAEPPVARNGLVFFVGPSNDGLDMLWVSDGTTAGTVAIGGAGRAPRSLAVDTTTATTRVWFSASDATNGRELWRSDGTTAGTVRATQLRAGAGDGLPAMSKGIAPLPSGVYFAGNNGSSGVELFRLVSPFAPVLYASLAAGAASSDPREFTWSGDYLLFVADGAGGREPYCVTSGTLQTIDLYPGPTGSMDNVLPQIVVYQPSLTQPFFYFGADGNTGNGRELWRYNPFSQVATEIDVVPGPGGSATVPRFVLGSRIIGWSTAIPGSRPLYAVNGGGTTVTTLLNATSEAFVTSTSPPQMGIVAVQSGNAGLWRSDGTVAGTAQISIPDYATSGTLLPAGAGCLLADGRRLGTTGAPSTLVPANPALNGGSAIDFVTSLGNGIALFAKDGAPWRSDGTAAGTSALVPGPNPPRIAAMGPEFGGRRWFTTQATPPSGQFSLYATDGTSAGTLHVGDLSAGISVQKPAFAVVGSHLLVATAWGFGSLALFGTDGTTVQPLATGGGKPCAMGNYALFASSNNPAIGVELCRTDGTPAGTWVVSDIQPGAGNGMTLADAILPLDSTTALLIGYGGSGQQVWRTSGTLLNTSVVSTFATSPPPGLELLASTGTGRVLFAATTANGRDLWGTNGTNAGTVMLVDDAGDEPKLLGKCNGAWLFTNRGPGLHDGGRLYRTNGTVASTSLVATLPTGRISDADETAVLDSYVSLAPQERLFRVGNVLFRTDGTASGTYALGTNPAVQWDSPTKFLAPPGADIAVFDGHDDGGFEVWRSGGALADTIKHSELNPGPASSNPRHFTHSGGLVFFSADDGQHGRELWAMPAMPTVLPYGVACAGTGGRFPNLVATAPPRLGSTFATELRDGLASSIALQSLGFTGLALPIGGGCSVLTSALVTDAFALDALGVGTPPPVAIPLSAALAGIPVFAQGAVLDPAGSFASLLSMTNGLQAIVGP